VSGLTLAETVLNYNVDKTGGCQVTTDRVIGFILVKSSGNVQVSGVSAHE